MKHWWPLLLLVVFNTKAQHTIPRAGLTIHSSVTMVPGIYRINNTKDSAGFCIEIAGNNLVVDFNNAVLDGSERGVLPDRFSGTAVYISSGKNITIKNLHAKGYKVALMASGIKGLVIENCDFSYNYRQHLYSTQQKEDLSDWMSYHHNEKDEWLRYGAAIYLRGCKKAVVHDNTVTGGQCGLMLTRCDSGLVYNNDFSFNSGIGVGMYRSSANKILHNKLDFNVRGHSEGVYNRGQDAAAILVFEQCNNNVYAFNSATHSGDGFFLWAGQTTMDSGEGGCNDNLIFKNDFSYAPTNGIEVTFSRNRIVGNKITGCDNAIWGGYSYNTIIKSNEIAGCSMGVAIEHGQDNTINFNWFHNNRTAIRLWGRALQPANWGYANKRDTRSRNYTIGYNRFTANQLVFDFLRTSALSGIKNDTGRNMVFLKSDTSVKELAITGFTCCDDTYAAFTKQEKAIAATRLPRKKNLTRVDSAWQGRSQIRMTGWGPYDFKSPLLWNTNPVASTDTLHFDIIGPAGSWKLLGQRGIKDISAITGTIPATITALKTNEPGQDVFIELEYTGKAIVTLFGENIDKGTAFRFNYHNGLLPVKWTVHWYGFDSSTNPVADPGMLAQVLQQPPILMDTVNDLDFGWWSGVGNKKKIEQFVTVAEAETVLPAGDYELGVSWEDVVRIYIDGYLVLDEWKPAQHVYDESPHRDIAVNLAGRHRIRVEQANQAGFAVLSVKVKKK
jgi:parallel beta-helix repeat protein